MSDPMITTVPLFEADAPPDAGASYLGAFTLLNPWAVWLIACAPELVAEPMSATSRAEKPPPCPEQIGTTRWDLCGNPMSLRHAPGRWVCYRHDEPVVVKIRPKYERAPDGDVLSLL